MVASNRKKTKPPRKTRVIFTVNKLPSYKFESPLSHVKSLDTRVLGATPPVKYQTSTRHTIAPAYNKGPYTVISKENIKDIGK